FREPKIQGATVSARTESDSPGSAQGGGNRVFLELALKTQDADLVPLEFGEPKIVVGIEQNTSGPAVGGGHSVLDGLNRRVDAPDLAPGNLRNPASFEPVAASDALGLAVRRGERKLEKRALGENAGDLVALVFREPHAVALGGESDGTASRCRDGKLNHGVGAE